MEKNNGLKLIHGRLSPRYDHFSEYEFCECHATVTRLMGVTALRVSWRRHGSSRPGFFQIIHLDYSEYGVDEYREFEFLPGDEGFEDKKHEMNDLWLHFINVMGGDVKSLEPSVMLRLISDAMPLAESVRRREYDSDENREFRRYAVMRLSLMKEALSLAGLSEADCSSVRAIRELMPPKLSAFESINYFVMRLTDCDWDAASAISSMDADQLRASELAAPGIQTLMKCDIEKSDGKTDAPPDGTSYPYRCRATTLAGDCYHMFTFVIWLSSSRRSKYPMVTALGVGTSMKLSEFEAAMQLSRSEYLTIYNLGGAAAEVPDMKLLAPFRSAIPAETSNGLLYTAYKDDNSHVDSPHYRLEGDVTGYVLITPQREIVFMSHDIAGITSLEKAFMHSIYRFRYSLKGRYLLESSVFQTLCMSPGALFDDLIVHDPD